MDDPNGTQGPEPSAGSRIRRPYEPPAIAWDEPWEAHANLMAACATKDVMQPGCETNTVS